jgi:hypothetical protein
MGLSRFSGRRNNACVPPPAQTIPPRHVMQIAVSIVRTVAMGKGDSLPSRLMAARRENQYAALCSTRLFTSILSFE